MRNGFEDKIAKLEQKFKLQLDEKEIEYEAISKQITKLQNQSQQDQLKFQIQINNATTNYNSIKNLNEELVNQKIALEEKVETLEDQKSDLEDKIKQLNEQIVDLNEQIRQLQILSSDQLSDINGLHKQIEELKENHQFQIEEIEKSHKKTLESKLNEQELKFIIQTEEIKRGLDTGFQNIINEKKELHELFNKNNKEQ